MVRRVDAKLRISNSHFPYFVLDVRVPWKDNVEFVQYCPFGPASQVQVGGIEEGIECLISPDVPGMMRTHTPFLSAWRYDPGWAEMLMIGHLSFLRAYFELLVPQEAIDSLLLECSKFEVASIN